MSIKAIDLVGKRFERLVVISRAENLKRNVRWLCKCDCGKTTTVQGGQLKNGTQKSCGCLRLEVITKHGHGYGKNGSKTYLAWSQMKSRCNNPNNKFYHDYGGRGIKVCERWDNFINFLEDMGEAPENKELDRIDNSKGYSPENCKWSTRQEQQNNRRNTVFYEYNGIKKSRQDLCREHNINPSTFENRLKRGWSIDRALTEQTN
jgi:hypothetical protein